MQKCLKKSGMVPKSQEWWQGIWNINFFRQSLKITSDILRYIRYSALQCHLAAAFCFIINVAWFIFSDLSSDARTSSCLYFKRYIIYGQNSQSQVFQQNNLLKLCIGSLVKSENCNRTASPPDLAHCAPYPPWHPPGGWVGQKWPKCIPTSPILKMNSEKNIFGRSKKLTYFFTRNVPYNTWPIMYVSRCYCILCIV